MAADAVVVRRARDAGRGALGAAQRVVRARTRRGGGHHRSEWRRQEHAAQADRGHAEPHRGHGAQRRPRRGHPRAGHGLQSRVHRSAECAARHRPDGPRSRRNPACDAGNRGIRRNRRLLRPAGPHLLQRHADARRLRRRNRVSARRADRRRSPVRGRRLFPAQELRAHPRNTRSRARRCCSSPTAWRTSARCATR